LATRWCTPHTAVSSITYLRQKALLLPPDISWPASSPDLSPIEQIWGTIKSQIQLSNVSDSQTLFNEVEKIWNSIDPSNYIRTLKARIWALEDLQGFSLAGHNDMIQIYVQHGNAGRDQARQIAKRNCIPIDAARNWLQMTQEVLKQASALILRKNPDAANCIDFDAFRASGAIFHAGLPGNR
jgi:hypothetical protein